MHRRNTLISIHSKQIIYDYILNWPIFCFYNHLLIFLPEKKVTVDHLWGSQNCKFSWIFQHYYILKMCVRQFGYRKEYCVVVFFISKLNCTHKIKPRVPWLFSFGNLFSVQENNRLLFLKFQFQWSLFQFTYLFRYFVDKTIISLNLNRFESMYFDICQKA